MLKGCERRMIKIENTESEIFEAAYLIIRQNAVIPKKCRQENMMKEALRITEGKLSGSAKKQHRREFVSKICFFVSGALASAAAFFLFTFFG